MLSHTALLVIGGAVMTGLLSALVFSSTGTPEERRMREEQKFLRALEAQRRIRDAQLVRQARRSGTRRVATQRPIQIEPPPVAIDDTRAIDEAPGAEQRAAERRRKHDEKLQAAALKAERQADKRAQHLAEQESKAAAKAQQAVLRAAEKQQRHEAKAALKAEQARERAEKLQLVPTPAAEPEPPARTEEEDDAPTKPLSELPLFSWANPDDDSPRRAG